MQTPAVLITAILGWAVLVAAMPTESHWTVTNNPLIDECRNGMYVTYTSDYMIDPVI